MSFSHRVACIVGVGPERFGCAHDIPVVQALADARAISGSWQRLPFAVLHDGKREGESDAECRFLIGHK